VSEDGLRGRVRADRAESGVGERLVHDVIQDRTLPQNLAEVFGGGRVPIRKLDSATLCPNSELTR
jgi:hypothetical protein